MRLESIDALVAGAGVGGAAAALLLARAGARVTLCERVAEPRAVGAGIALAPNGLAVLDGLGLAEELTRRGRRLDAPRIVDGRGRVLLSPRFDGIPGDPHILVLRRSDLQDVLLAAVAREARIDIRLGTSVEAAAPDGTVAVRTASGEARLAADLVIGADGVDSRVRDGGDFATLRVATGISYVRGLSAIELARSEEAWTPAGIFGSFPVPGGAYFFTSSGTPALAAALAARDLEAFSAIWREAYPPAEEILSGVSRFDRLLVNEVVRIDCARFHAGRLALLGDAAHAMAPNLGQGANSALVDAAVLLDVLRSAVGIEAALTAYTARRRDAVRWVQATAGRLGRLAERTSPLARALRDRLLMPLAARLPPQARNRKLLQEAPDRLREMARRGPDDTAA